MYKINSNHLTQNIQNLVRNKREPNKMTYMERITIKISLRNKYLLLKSNLIRAILKYPRILILKHRNK